MGGADPVVEIQADQQPEDAAAGGDEHIGDAVEDWNDKLKMRSAQ